MDGKCEDNEVGKMNEIGECKFAGDTFYENVRRPLPEELKCLQCPFTWKRGVDGPKGNVITLVETKLAGSEDEGESCSPWTKFILNLVLCYEYANNGKIQDAMQKQKHCVDILKDSGTPKFYMPKMGIGLKHVSLACEIFIHYYVERHEEVNKFLIEIPKIEDMDCKDKASIWAIRGAFFLEYGFQGMKDSVPFIEKAIDLDPQCAELHFLLGKAMSRARRIEKQYYSSCEKELKSLEFAVNHSDDVFYKVVLAQSYIDAAKFYQRKSHLVNVYKIMNQKAADTYRKAYDDCNDNPYILGRCAYGLMALPPPWQDLHLAEKSITKALRKTSNNCFLDVVAGNFYKMKEDLNKAEFYYGRAADCGTFSAILKLLDVRKRKERKHGIPWDPVPDLERYLKCFMETEYKVHLLCLLGLFYYLMKHDFDCALKYWCNAIESDFHSSILKECKNPWSPKINISETIIDEIFKRLKKGVPVEQENLYRKVLVKYSENDPDLVNNIMVRR